MRKPTYYDEEDDILQDSQSADQVLRNYYLSKKKNEEAIQAAAEQADMNRLYAQLGKVGSSIGDAIAGVPTDKAGYDEILKNADAPIITAKLKNAEEQDYRKAVRDYFLAKERQKLASVDKEKDRDLRKEIAQMGSDAKKDAMDATANAKQLEREDKKKASVREVQERANNINSNIDLLDKMIGEKGTFEMIGPHNQSLDRMVDQIAVDAAKLMDPESVARPGEVELVKKGLVESGFKNKNKTAREVLQNFKKEIEGRVATAYKIRDLERPSTTSGTRPPQQQTKVVNGKTYRKVPGGWEEVN